MAEVVVGMGWDKKYPAESASHHLRHLGGDCERRVVDVSVAVSYERTA